MKNLSMSAKVFLGFGIGIILGLIFQKDILWLQPIGDLFLKLIKMIVVPVVFLSIISGISSIGDIGKLKRPLFFVENQSYFLIENPHNKFTPRISKMIITLKIFGLIISHSLYLL